MNRIIEILRRFSMAFIYIVGIFSSIIVIISGFNANENIVIIIGVVCFILTFVVAKLVNWIFGN